MGGKPQEEMAKTTIQKKERKYIEINRGCCCWSTCIYSRDRCPRTILGPNSRSAECTKSIELNTDNYKPHSLWQDLHFPTTSPA